MLIWTQGENMAETTKNILIYGVPFSQPVRAVMWLMLIKKFPFELKLTNPGSSSEVEVGTLTSLKSFPLGLFRV